jgi:hypothetical protein
MKTIKELYFILYNNFHLLENRPHLYEVEDEKIEDEGLCDLIAYLSKGHYEQKPGTTIWSWKYYCNDAESNLLYKDFIKRKPKWYNSKFWWNKSFNKFNSNNKPYEKSYWWSLDEKGNIQRKLFIESIIKNYENTYN